MCICSTIVSRKGNLTGISHVQNLHRFKLNDVHFLHVYGEKRYSVRRERQEAYCRQYLSSTYVDDCREPHGGKGCDGEGGVNLINKNNL